MGSLYCFYRLGARRLAYARRKNASRVVGGDHRQCGFWRASLLARCLSKGRPWRLSEDQGKDIQRSYLGVFMYRLLIVGILLISTSPLSAQAQQPDVAKLKVNAQNGR